MLSRILSSPTNHQNVTIRTCKVNLIYFTWTLILWRLKINQLQTCFLLSVTFGPAVPFNICTHRGYIDKCVPMRCSDWPVLMMWLGRHGYQNKTRPAHYNPATVSRSEREAQYWEGIYSNYRQDTKRESWDLRCTFRFTPTKNRYFLSTFIKQHISLPA